MSKKRNDFGIFVLVGICVLAVAFLTGCSGGDNGGSRGNDEGPPSEDGGDPPAGEPTEPLPEEP